MWQVKNKLSGDVGFKTGKAFNNWCKDTYFKVRNLMIVIRLNFVCLNHDLKIKGWIGFLQHVFQNCGLCLTKHLQFKVLVHVDTYLIFKSLAVVI